MYIERVHDERLDSAVGDDIGGDGIDTDYHQEKGPPLLVRHVYHGIKEGQEQKADAPTEDSPRRCPDALHDGVDAGNMQQNAEGHQAEKTGTESQRAA